MPIRPLLSRNANRSSPRILIFLGGPSRSGSSSDSSAGIQKRRNSSPIGVPLPLPVRNSLSALLSMLRFVLRCCLRQSLLQIGDDVVSRFDPYRQADHVGTGAGRHPLFVGELTVRRRGGVDDQTLGVTDIRKVREEVYAVDHLHADLVAALHAEGEDR